MERHDLQWKKQLVKQISETEVKVEILTHYDIYKEKIYDQNLQKLWISWTDQVSKSIDRVEGNEI